MIVVADRNEPKGIFVFTVALPAARSTIENIAATHIDDITAIYPAGYPNKKPIKKINFISPRPIHLPFDAKNSITKNEANPKAEKNGLEKLVLLFSNFKPNTTTISKINILSGIIR